MKSVKQQNVTKCYTKCSLYSASSIRDSIACLCTSAAAAFAECSVTAAAKAVGEEAAAEVACSKLQTIQPATLAL